MNTTHIVWDLHRLYYPYISLKWEYTIKTCTNCLGVGFDIENNVELSVVHHWDDYRWTFPWKIIDQGVRVLVAFVLKDPSHWPCTRGDGVKQPEKLYFWFLGHIRYIHDAIELFTPKANFAPPPLSQKVVIMHIEQRSNLIIQTQSCLGVHQ
jgi:hypothetical protein